MNEINNHEWEESVFGTLDELSILVANISEPILSNDMSPEIMIPIISTYKKIHEKNAVCARQH